MAKNLKQFEAKRAVATALTLQEEDPDGLTLDYITPQPRNPLPPSVPANVVLAEN